MQAQADKIQVKINRSRPNDALQKKGGGETSIQFEDNRPEARAQRDLHELANDTAQVSQLRVFQDMANNSPQAKQAAQLQQMTDSYSPPYQQLIQKKENNTGLPDGLKTGMENLSGLSLDTPQQEAVTCLKVIARVNSARKSDQGAERLPVPNAQQPIQMQKVNVGVSGKITSITQWPKERLGGSLRGHEGDHTTAYTSFKEMVGNRVHGLTPKEAIDALLQLIPLIETLPGMQKKNDNTKVVYQCIKLAKENLKAAKSDDIKPYEILDILAAAAGLLVRARNTVSLSSMLVSSSSGGHGEAVAAHVSAKEHALQDGKKLGEVDAQQALEFIWQIFDYRPTESIDKKELANVILQHIWSMQMTYPLVYEWLSNLGEPYYLLNSFHHSPAAEIVKNRDDGAEILKVVSVAVIKGVPSIGKIGANPDYDRTNVLNVD